jgi:hypothetical protein
MDRVENSNASERASGGAPRHRELPRKEWRTPVVILPSRLLSAVAKTSPSCAADAHFGASVSKNTVQAS